MLKPKETKSKWYWVEYSDGFLTGFPKKARFHRLKPKILTEKGKKKMKYNYFEAVKEDVRNVMADTFISEEIIDRIREDKDGFFSDLYDMFWIDDNITGNASGSYTCNREAAKEYVFADTETVQEALKEFCVDADTIADKFLSEDWEYFDVITRCYCLSSVIWEVVEELEEKYC